MTLRSNLAAGALATAAACLAGPLHAQEPSAEQVLDPGAEVVCDEAGSDNPLCADAAPDGEAPAADATPAAEAPAPDVAPATEAPVADDAAAPDIAPATVTPSPDEAPAADATPAAEAPAPDVAPATDAPVADDATAPDIAPAAATPPPDEAPAAEASASDTAPAATVSTPGEAASADTPASDIAPAARAPGADVAPAAEAPEADAASAAEAATPDTAPAAGASSPEADAGTPAAGAPAPDIAPARSAASDAEAPAASEAGRDGADRPSDDARQSRRERRAARRAGRAPSDRPVEALSGGAPAETASGQVTDETARSSSEDFAGDGAAAARDGGDGLSALGKFALGAAGLVALDAILGANADVVENSGERVVVRRDGGYDVYRDDNVLLRRPGADVATETYSDGSTRTVVTRENGVRVVTIADPLGRVIRRVKVLPDGREVVLVDDTAGVRPVETAALPSASAGSGAAAEAGDDAALRAALRAEASADLDRDFSLWQVRNIREVRLLMPEITLDQINFDSGSAAIRPAEAEELYDLGTAMQEVIAEDPDEVFLIEGHTDAVGDAAYNLLLSDRRAESVALALTEYFDVPPENMFIQGYGEQFLKVPTEGAERANRRAVVRRITPLLRTAETR